MHAKRAAIFLVGCIGARLLLVLLAYHLARREPRALRAMALVAIAVSIGFFFIWSNGLRKTGPETFGEPIWWNDLRPVHSALYAVFAVLAFREETQRHAWAVLLADVAIGLWAWGRHNARAKAQ
jgi:drug/metabolite transporter (DMT)-like permease